MREEWLGPFLALAEAPTGVVERRLYHPIKPLLVLTPHKNFQRILVVELLRYRLDGHRVDSLAPKAAEPVESGLLQGTEEAVLRRLPGQ